MGCFIVHGSSVGSMLAYGIAHPCLKKEKKTNKCKHLKVNEVLWSP
jgi:hypothetical protein